MPVLLNFFENFIGHYTTRTGLSFDIEISRKKPANHLLATDFKAAPSPQTVKNFSQASDALPPP